MNWLYELNFELVSCGLAPFDMMEQAKIITT
jgi:hypothetical protein